jgi:lantibiotic modifying enzyme
MLAQTTHNYETQQKKYLDTAVNIANYLAREAVWDGDRCNWLGHVVEPLNGKYQVIRRSFSRDFYNGTSGIAYFLALLLSKYEDPIIEDTLRGCMNQVLSMTTEDDNLGSNYGFYGGRIGVASAIIEVGKLRNNEDWKKQGFELLDQLCEKEIAEFELDIISGVAGGIPLLLKYYKETNKPNYLAAAKKAGDFLIQTADKQQNAWGWKVPMAEQSLTGYSHGNAGEALALLELYAVTQDTQHYTAAMYAFNYERLLYNPTVQNWPDLRDLSSAGGNTTGPVYAETWCHGAPGIALSRIRAWELTQDNSFLQEAEIALSTTYRNVYNTFSQPNDMLNYSLCHGIAGNTDILLEGAKKLNKNNFLQIANQVGDYGIQRFSETGLSWPSGVNDPSGMTKGMAETPGFMLGISGTGYFYLRLAFLDEVESALVL